MQRCLSLFVVCCWPCAFFWSKVPSRQLYQTLSSAFKTLITSISNLQRKSRKGVCWKGSCWGFPCDMAGCWPFSSSSRAFIPFQLQSVINQSPSIFIEWQISQQIPAGICPFYLKLFCISSQSSRDSKVISYRQLKYLKPFALQNGSVMLADMFSLSSL